ncbi:hypothetical protein G7Y79_00063g093870 [Physcia stellaris]|nr:hypothetical protein G7Y79_00063g093870 [Physcia stellaris]
MSPPAPPNISNSLRILYISPPQTEKLVTLRGSTLPISTPYYSATIPIWHDQISLTPTAIKEWEAEWRAGEAGEVVRSLGAWVVAIPKPLTKDDLCTIRTLLNTLSSLVSHHTSEAVDSYQLTNEPLLLCLGVHQPTLPQLEITDDDWEDLCREAGGWEWIDGEAEGEGTRNEFGEKVGIARLIEALEAHEWEDAGDRADLPDDLQFNEDEGLSQSASDTLDLDSAAKEPILIRSDGKAKDIGQRSDIETNTDTIEGEEDDQVQELENMMLKLQAIKDMGADMPEAERRKLAAKAVGDVMRKI